MWIWLFSETATIIKAILDIYIENYIPSISENPSKSHGGLATGHPGP